MHYQSTLNKYIGILCIIVGALVIVWVVLPLIVNLAFALVGVLLCLYGISLKNGGRIDSQFSSWYYRMRL